MTRFCTFVMAWGGLWFACVPSLAARPHPIIPETEAGRHGLTRAWFTQIDMDRARTRVAEMVLDRGTLFVQTDRAALHAVDAETGQTLWSAEVGRRGHPSLAPAANSDLVAVVNGSYLYLLDRHNGKLLWSTQLEGVPGSAAVLSQRRVYVPMHAGKVFSYVLERRRNPVEASGATAEDDVAAAEPEAGPAEAIRLSHESIVPLACQSTGQTLVQPIVIWESPDREHVVWPTDRGHLNLGRYERLNDRFMVRYRLETQGPIVSRPVHRPSPSGEEGAGTVFAASLDGFVYAIRAGRGETLWRFALAEPVYEPLIVAGDRVYVVTQPGGLYCLDAADGTDRWWTYGVAQFVSASKERVYVADRRGHILVLAAATGARLDTISAADLPIKLRNAQNDRIYLATGSGLVQCLRETELSEPFEHTVAPVPPAEASPTEEPSEEEPVPQPGKKQPPTAGSFETSTQDAASEAQPPASLQGDNPFQ